MQTKLPIHSKIFLREIVSIVAHMPSKAELITTSSKPAISVFLKKSVGGIRSVSFRIRS
jgi:hypothetical protein